jgi:hypothetical protein
MCAAFAGGWFGEDHSLYADFPKEGEQERAIVRLTPYGNLQVIAPIEKGLVNQHGSYLVREECAKDSGFIRRDCTVTLQDFTGKNTIWSRRFAREAPVLNWNMQSETVLLHWPIAESAAHEEMQQFSELKGKAEKDDYLFEQLDFRKDTCKRQVAHQNQQAIVWNSARCLERRLAAVGRYRGSRSHIFVSFRPGERTCLWLGSRGLGYSGPVCCLHFQRWS